MRPPLDRFLEWSLGCVIPPNSNICTCVIGILQKSWLKKSVPPVPGKYRKWTEPIWGIIQVGLEHVQGTVLSRFKDCSGADQGLFWTRPRIVLRMIEDCSEHDWGMFWAWTAMEWSRFGYDLSPDWNRSKTEPGPVQDLSETDGTTEMPANQPGH